MINLEKKRCAHNYNPLPVVITKGKGVWLYDEEGNKYMDMLSAYSAVSHGHCHKRLVRAMKKQLGKVTLPSRAVYNDQLGPFLEEACTLAGFDMALPANGGVESVETAIKAARRWKGIDDPEIIVCNENFHGRTITAISFSTVPAYKKGFGPLTPGFISIPFGDARALENAITDKTAAFLVETIQGEGGINLPPAGYFQKVREICDRKGILLILDEIQVGLGRTGKMFAFEHEGIRPDCLILGKALSGGLYPVSLFLANQEIMHVFDEGSHGSTFGGNPLGAAVAYEALRVIQEEKLTENSAQLGAYMLKKLEKIQSHPKVKDVRGRGLYIGIELTIPARDICEKLLKEGIIVKETHDTIIRLAPPLVITKRQINLMLSKVLRCVASL